MRINQPRQNGGRGQINDARVCCVRRNGCRGPYFFDTVALDQNRLIAQHLAATSIKEASGFDQSKSLSRSLAPGNGGQQYRHDCQRSDQDVLLEIPDEYDCRMMNLRLL
jgi:hypothetical protein